MESMVDADELMAYQGVVNLRIFFTYLTTTSIPELVSWNPIFDGKKTHAFRWRCSRKPWHCHIYWWYPHQISPFYPISIIFFVWNPWVSTCFNMFQHGNALKLPSGELTFCHGKIHHFIAGKIHYFDWAIFHSFLLVHQRVYPIFISLWITIKFH